MAIERTIPLMFKARVQACPDIIAQASKNEKGEFEKFTYARLYKDVIQFAAGLKKLGIRRADNVAFFSDNRREWLIADLAILSLGAIDVPRGKDSMAVELRFITSFAGCVFGIFKHHKFLKKKFRYHINNHCNAEHNVFNGLETGVFCREIIAEQYRNGRKNKVVAEHLEHSYGNIVCRLKGKFAVEGEIPHNRKNKGNKVNRAVLVAHYTGKALVVLHKLLNKIRFYKNLIHQCEAAHLNNPGRGGETGVFYELQNILFKRFRLLFGRGRPVCVKIFVVFHLFLPIFISRYNIL